jgi:protein gp37
MSKSIIAWTTYTANFWMGCTKVSAGCKNCYAETLTKNRMSLDVWGPNAPRQPVKSVYANLRKWNRESDPNNPSKVFVGSLMDWAEDHPGAEALRPALWDAIRQNDRLIFQVLTKRADRIAECLPADWGEGWPHVWLGTSIEDMQVAERADHLRKVNAVVRFISYEPALGPLDDLDLTGLDWIIFGGESGPGYRPMKVEWARSMRDKCRAAAVAFFYKQSAAYRTEMGIELDGEIVREYPTPRGILQHF